MRQNRLSRGFPNKSGKIPPPADAGTGPVKTLPLFEIDFVFECQFFFLCVDFYIAVPFHSGSCRDQFSEDNVFLQSNQRIDLSFDGRVGKNFCRLLERCCGQERVICSALAVSKFLSSSSLFVFSNSSTSIMAPGR